MKKTLLLILALIILIFTVKYTYTTNKHTDITYAAEKYLTTGVFNKNKLCSVDEFFQLFSDGTISIVKVTGKQAKAPHKKTSYKLLLEKNKKGLWKVKKVYTQPN